MSLTLEPSLMLLAKCWLSWSLPDNSLPLHSESPAVLTMHRQAFRMSTEVSLATISSSLGCGLFVSLCEITLCQKRETKVLRCALECLFPFFWSASGLKFVQSEMNHTACGLLRKWWRKLGHKMKRQFGEGISCNVGVGPDWTPPFGSLPGTSKWEETQQ